MAKYYTVAEANRLLPELTALLHELQEQAESLTHLQADLKAIRLQILSNGHGKQVEQVTIQVATREHQVRQNLARLQTLGIELKDLQMGLIDFYHQRDDAVVFLCWRLGEPEVTYWHPLDRGYSSRQPL